MTPKVRVSIYMSGNDIDLNIITDRLAIRPSKVRKKSEWPQASISAGIAHDVWLWKTDKEECKAVSIQFDKLQQVFLPKMDVINELREIYSLDISVTVVVEMEAGDGPELVLSESNIAFLASINASVGFDMYID